MKPLNQILGLCLAGGLFLSTPAAAEECCSWNGCFTVGAELLYWQPCKCEWTWASKITLRPEVPGTDFDFLSIKERPDFGFRLYGFYTSESGCSFTTLSWTHLRATNSGRVGPVDPANLETLIIPALSFREFSQATASEKQEYDRVFLQMGRYLYRNRCANFYAYAGIEFIDIDQKRTIEALDVDVLAEYHEKSEFYAIGLDLGIGGEYELGCGFNISARAGGIAAVGRRKHRSDFNIPVTSQSRNSALAEKLKEALPTALQQVPPTGRVEYPSSVGFVPGAEARVGIGYLLSCGCRELEIEIGYAIEHYFKSLDVTQVGDSQFFDSSCEDIGFSGPYLKFLFRF